MSLDPYGLRRVVGEPGVLPQQALRVDPSLPIGEDELLLDVEALNVDAASFRQLEHAAGADPRRIGEAIRAIVAERGKLHNPVTGSGGMLLGKVRQIGPRHPAAATLRPGTRLASLVSLTLTPLWLEAIDRVDPQADRVDVRGHAILFATGLFAELPADLPEALVLSALDVCGAPALAARHLGPGQSLLVIGAGKSGALCCAQARRSGARRIVACDISPAAVDDLARRGLAEPLALDATRALDVLGAAQRLTDGQLFDVVINVASVPGTEMASLLAVRDGGTVIFFSMATSFTRAALGAEGIGKDALLIVGNGYAPGHAQRTIDLLREEPELRDFFVQRSRRGAP